MGARVNWLMFAVLHETRGRQARRFATGVVCLACATARAGDEPGARPGSFSGWIGSLFARPRPLPEIVLTAEEQAGLKTEGPDGQTDGRVEFVATFESGSDVGSASPAAVGTGNAPFRITAQLFLAHPGRPATRVSRGDCGLYLLDAEGRVALKATAPLRNMCPS